MPNIQDLSFAAAAPAVFNMTSGASDDELPVDMFDGPFATTLHSRQSSSAVSSTDPWRCWTCGNSAFEWRDHWICTSCQGVEFYNVRQTERRETREGVWLFMPRQMSSHPEHNRVDGVSFPHVPGQFSVLPSYPNPSEDSVEEAKEWNESETLTNDPIVDPDTSLDVMHKKTRRRRRQRAQSTTMHPQQDESETDLSQNLGNLVKLLQKSLKTHKSDNSSQESWNSKKGPEKGVRFRGGAPPNPPAWRYSRDDIRSFPKWQKKLAVWKKQIQAYMPLADAALMLYTSLSGEPEEELEHIDLERLHHHDGIDYIESLLKQGLETKLIYQKRKLMNEFETIVRQQSESMRAFVNRYRRAERSLESIGVKPSGMYDSEAMGNRLLERSRLSPENGRLVLIGSSFNLSFEAIAESLCMTFPEHKQLPPLFGKDGQPIKAFQKRDSFSSSSSGISTAASSSSSTSASSSKGKGKGKSKFHLKQAFATEHTELEAVQEEVEADEDENIGEEFHDVEEEYDGHDANENDDDADAELPDFSEVVECLTVTAKKLQSLTLGRKYTGDLSIQERKKVTTCSACGEPGHWLGDAECSKTATSKSSGKAMGKGKSKSKSDGKPKKVFFTTTTQQGPETHQLPEQPPEVPNYFSFMINMVTSNHQVFYMDSSSMVGLMVLDTACQRMCCGSMWLDEHTKILKQHRLLPHLVPTAEVFQFGRGGPIAAKARAYIPSCIGGLNVLLGASIVETGIPLLASNTFLESTGAVLDLGNHRVHFAKLGISVDMRKVNDHLTIRRAVEMAVFFYGYPEMIDEHAGIPGEEAEILHQQDQPTEPNVTQEVFYEEIAFPGTSGIDKSIKMATARMHKNMGHLPPHEMIKLLALNGITSDQVIKCIKAMQCAACKRAKGPFQPNPATSNPQYLGQFADNLQADIFYLRDITTRNYPVLGIICEATHLHSAVRLQSRKPSDVFSAFRSAWLQNFGYPMRLSVDDDGAFKAEFDDKVTEGGTHLNVVPPEAHHQLGTIERHNSTLRMLLERIVDSSPCSCPEDIDNALIAGVQAKNSATWSSGRPPYIAAFGKIPRFGTDLLSDPRALVSGSTHAEAQQQSALMRAEALKALAEASASSTLRRALLRKTNVEHDIDPVPGSLLAYWRWTVRSHRKRGGYRIARYLGKDPDGRNFWVQSGSQTVRVAKNQIREVFGYEQYVPSAEDLQALKIAEANIRCDNIVDELIPEEVEIPPPEAAELEFQDTEFPEIVIPPNPQQEQEQPASQSEQPPTSPTSVQIRQSIRQTQNIFSPMTPLHSTPFTPSRRHRSRTPTTARKKSLLPPQEPLALQGQRNLSEIPPLEDLEPAVQDPYQTQRPGDHASEPHQEPSQHEHPVNQGDRELHEGTQLPQQAAVIDLTDENEQADPGEMIPQTPPEIADSQEAQPPAILPSKRPFDALKAGVIQARRVNDHSYEIYNYKSSHGAPFPDLQCWARLDLLAQEPKLSMTTGPSLSTVTWRRTLNAMTGEVLFEGPVQPELEQDECHHFKEPINIVTELWHSHTMSACSTSFLGFDDALEEIPEGWDGSFENPFTGKNVFYKVYVNYLAEGEQDFESTLSESSTDEDDMSTGTSKAFRHATKLTRQEKKAIEKELKCSDVMLQSPDYIQAFVDATKKEALSFQTWKSLKPVPPQEAKRILADPILRRRVMSSRAVYKDKSKGIPPLRAKCRVVIRGNQDPDLRSISRNAPTPSRLSEYLLLSIFVSGANQKAFGTATVWVLWSGDVSTAFLQGQQNSQERNGKIFMRPPSDEIISRAEVFQSSLYEIVGNVYGLANAPFTWTEEVSRRLLALGFRVHSFDRMMFYYINSDGKTCAVLVVYVDDFLLTHDSSFPFQSFVEAFTWGSQTYVTPGNPVTFKGKELEVCVEQNGETTLHITQTSFIEALEKGTPIKKADHEKLLEDHQWPEYRSISGCLQWLAGQTRLDLASVVSLSNRGNETRGADLDMLNEALLFAKSTKDQGLKLYGVPIDQSTTLVGYSDSSWANAKNSASQHGTLILLAPTSVSEKASVGALIDWKSSRSKRVCRSTLAAESVAADSCSDRLVFAQYSLAELIFHEPSHKVGKRLRMLLVTDCKSLYDCVSSPNPNCEDRRSLVNIRSIQEVINSRTIHWVPTVLQMSDCLTKISKQLRITLLKWLARPIIQLRKEA